MCKIMRGLVEFLWHLKGFYAFEVLCHAPNIRVRVRDEDGWIGEWMEGLTLSAPNGARDSSHSFKHASRANNRLQGLK